MLNNILCNSSYPSISKYMVHAVRTQLVEITYVLLCGII